MSTLSHEMEVAYSTVHRWSKGVIPAGSMLVKLAQTLGVDVNYFLPSAEPSPNSSPNAIAMEDNNRVAETDSTYISEGLNNDRMVKLTPSPPSKRELRSTQVANEIRVRLLMLPDSSPSVRKVLKEEIMTRVNEYERMTDMDLDKPQN